MGDVGLCMNQDEGRKEVQHFRKMVYSGAWWSHGQTAAASVRHSRLLKALFLFCLSLALIKIFYELSITTVPPYGFFSQANPYIFDQLRMFQHFHLKWEGTVFLAVFTAFVAIRVW
ncbi:hypothetical protein ILYODFUR_000272 [Ilyodon furcidens]|uniref:CASP-like protein n=1 Tax=Ilyodon furcidens TaxID=33524 RepID=A0ABV0V058_9TELE